MKPDNPDIERYRIRFGQGASDRTAGNNGRFKVPVDSKMLFVIASDGLGWEHVSVSHPSRVPTWDEMNCIKDLFWAEDETVIQYHAPRSEYVNNHPRCLHLWKPVGVEIPRPPMILV
ncbi:MAG TPA: hypothetical protein VFR55_08390 [Dehalococcoidia bacterium]|nr:hypothetical protein [Dehalococcoidia bacterium]